MRKPIAVSATLTNKPRHDDYLQVHLELCHCPQHCPQQSQLTITHNARPRLKLTSSGLRLSFGLLAETYFYQKGQRLQEQ